MVLIETKAFEPGTRATFSPLLLKEPLIPGPLTKKPKTSLNFSPTYSQYSSEAKTYLKFTKLSKGTKSNSIPTTSKTGPVANLTKSTSLDTSPKSVVTSLF